MQSEKFKILGRMLLVTDLLLVAATFVTAFELRLPQLSLLTDWTGDPAGTSAFVTGSWSSQQAHLLIGLAALLAWPAILNLQGLYDFRRLVSRWRSLGRMLQAALMVGVVLAAFAFFFKLKDVSRAVVAVSLGLSIVTLWSSRMAAVAWLKWRGKRAPQRLLIVGTGSGARRLGDLVVERTDLGYGLAGYLTTGEEQESEVSRDRILGSAAEIGEILDHEVIDQVAVAVPTEQLHEMEQLVLSCEEVGVDVAVVADFFDCLLARASVDQLEGIPLLRLHASPQFRATMMGKRVFDLIGAGLGLLLAAPIMILTALAVKLTSPGPVFFVQTRLGLNGRPFNLYKFRSMRAGAEEQLEDLKSENSMNGPTFKMRDDPRVTWVGKIIRKLSIDELPQLFNVLVGQMSLVGPRPPVPAEVSEYDRWQRRRLSVKPGLTCTWQVSGRNEIDFEEWMRLDLDYIDNWSPWLDLKIILQTIPAVLTGRGAS